MEEAEAPFVVAAASHPCVAVVAFHFAAAAAVVVVAVAAARCLLVALTAAPIDLQPAFAVAASQTADFAASYW